MGGKWYATSRTERDFANGCLGIRAFALKYGESKQIQSSSVLDSLRRTARQLGTPTAVLYWASRLLQRVSGGHVRLLRYVLVAQPVPPDRLTPAGRGKTIDVTEASEQTVRATQFGRPHAIVERRVAVGSRCLLARKNGTLVGFQWFTTQDYPEDEVRCIFELRPQDRCAWDFDVFVHPDYRTQPVFMRLWDECNALLRAENISLTLSRINAFNTDSLWAHRRLGARRIAAATFVTAGPWQLAWLPRFPWLHLSRRSAARLAISRLARDRQRSN
jgi:GNAT superfamily N-acetyltransferase